MFAGSSGVFGPATWVGGAQVTPSSFDFEKTMRLPGGPLGEATFCVHTAMSEPSGPSKTRKCSLWQSCVEPS